MRTEPEHRWSVGQWIVLVAGAVAAVLIWTRSVPLPGWTSATPDRSDDHPQLSLTERPLVFAGGIVEGDERELPLRFEVPGRIKSIPARAGQPVEAGAVLAELETDWAERLVHEAELRLRIARAQRDAANTAQRQALGSSGRGQLVSAPAASADDGVLADQVALAESAVQRERLNLEKCTLRAPQAGIVVEIPGQLGTLAGPQLEQPVVTVAPRAHTRVRAFVEELDALDVATGQRALVVVAGKPDRQYRGQIVDCAAQVRPKPHRHLRPGERLDVRTREILIQLDDGSDLLLGLPVEVYIKPRGAGESTATGPSER